MVKSLQLALLTAVRNSEQQWPAVRIINNQMNIT